MLGRRRRKKGGLASRRSGLGCGLLGYNEDGEGGCMAGVEGIYAGNWLWCWDWESLPCSGVVCILVALAG